MKIDKFEDIESWKEARILVREIYQLFANLKDYGFRDQIQRAAISVMSNIAEGFDRNTNKEFIRETPIPKAKRNGIGKLQ